MTELNKMIKIDVISVPFSGHLFPTLTLVKPLLEDPRFQYVSSQVIKRRN